MTAKKLIFIALDKEGIETNGVRHKKLMSIYFNMFDFQRPIELRWQDYIIQLLDLGLLGKLTPKLKAEPKTVISEQKKKYLEYINSNEWRAFRARALEHYGHRCILCDSIHNIHLHHKTYRNLYKETFEDVIPLCAACHKRHHKK